LAIGLAYARHTWGFLLLGLGVLGVAAAARTFFTAGKVVGTAQYDAASREQVAMLLRAPLVPVESPLNLANGEICYYQRPVAGGGSLYLTNQRVIFVSGSGAETVTPNAGILEATPLPDGVRFAMKEGPPLAYVTGDPGTAVAFARIRSGQLEALPEEAITRILPQTN
jgi:hypothetical protein